MSGQARVAPASAGPLSAVARRSVECRDSSVVCAVHGYHGWVVWICTVQKFRAFAPAPRFRAFGAKACGFGQNFRAFASSAVPGTTLRFALLTVLGPRRAAPLTCRIKRRIHNRHVIFQPWAQEIVTKYRASKPFGRRLRSRAVPCGPVRSHAVS